MQVKISDVQQTLVKIILDKSQLSAADANILAADYLEGELQGKKSHGLAAFPAMVEKLAAGTASFKILRETGSLIYADAGGSFGAIVGRKLADLAIDKAKKQGVAVAVVRDMKSWLRPGIIAQYIADKNMVGWVVNTGGSPMVAPPGGRDPVIGTNPLGIGIPTADKPLVVDMATSKRAWGEIRVAKNSGQALPAASFIDSDGLPTLDPDAVHAALPMGDYKGFGLGLFIQMLGGSLVGMDMGAGDSGENYRTGNRGALILVINPELTVGSTQFKTDNQAFVDSIRHTPPAAGSTGVTLPGDRAAKTKRDNEAKGYLEVDDALWREITAGV